MNIKFISLFVIFFACSYVLEDGSFPIDDLNNDGYDDNDILFLQKLIDNSQGNAIAPDPNFNPLDIGEQIWVEGRLRVLKHSGGVGGFYFYGQIPVEIKDVEFLNKLVFIDNYFTSIPEEIQQLRNLSEVILNDNRFTGPVPEGLWLNKSNLKNLSIFNNYFSSLPESICDYQEGITNFIISHNNLCDIPECITNSSIQSCDCYEYITMDICFDINDDLGCAKTLGDIIDNCPLSQFWGTAAFNQLNNIDPHACVSWEGSCDSTLSIENENIAFGIDITNGCIDCNGNNCDNKMSWIGDGICDESNDLSFSCPEFNCDMEDCGFYLEEQSSCYCQRDCSGKCINQNECAGLYSYYDCCIDDGTCEDVIEDGEIIDWVGDGYCDDGTWGLSFNCLEVDGFQFNCDDGDCGFWNESTGQCEPLSGQIIQYHDNYIKE